MKREADLQRQLRGLETLGEAVGAMKSLSAHHLRETRAALTPAHVYREGVERILASSGATLGAGPGPAGLVVIGAEHGLCGSHNSRLAAAGALRRSELGPGPTLCVGQRAAALLARRGVVVRHSYGGPAGVRGITDLLLCLAEDLLETYVTEQLSSFEIVASSYGGIGNDPPVNLRLLPFEPPRATRVPAIRYVGAQGLRSAAIREYLYIALYDVILRALASEHGARLLATQAAEKWLDERAGRLRRLLAATRRESSTQEMIEISSGARARNGAARRSARVPRAF